MGLKMEQRHWEAKNVSEKHQVRLWPTQKCSLGKGISLHPTRRGKAYGETFKEFNEVKRFGKLLNNLHVSISTFLYSHCGMMGTQKVLARSCLPACLPRKETAYPFSYRPSLLLSCWLFPGDSYLVPATSQPKWNASWRSNCLKQPSPWVWAKKSEWVPAIPSLENGGTSKFEEEWFRGAIRVQTDPNLCSQHSEKRVLESRWGHFSWSDCDSRSLLPREEIRAHLPSITFCIKPHNGWSGKASSCIDCFSIASSWK